jgi:hypothetical protein
MEKILLSDFLRKEIQAKYGSISFFAKETGFSYERLRKAIQRNNFSRDDLGLFAEKLGIIGLDFKNFEYNLGRRTTARLQRKELLLEKSISGIVPEELIPFVINNPIVLTRIRELVEQECRRIKDTINA